MRQTLYKLDSKAFSSHFRMVLVSDLHSGNPQKTISALKDIAPNYILMAGDILEALDGTFDKKNEEAFEIFERAAQIAPTFYCTGNHEDGGVHSQSKKWKIGEGKKREYSDKNLQRIRASGVEFVLDSYVIKDGIAFGGLASGLICKNGTPNIDFLKRFSMLEYPKVLICHHPEYYEKYLKDLPIDVIVSGHAHGGQWRIFGRGLYAPGQGILPRYTSGVYDGRLVISKGLKSPFPIPRFFNPREIVIIDI